MFLSSWRKFVQSVRRQRGAIRRGNQQPAEARKSRWLFVEELEERTLLTTTAIWAPQGSAPFNWTNNANWQGGVAPVNQGDVAIFQGTITSSPTLDASITVGEIDFNSPSNVVINQGSSSFTITFDNTPSATSSIKTLSTNGGLDTINVGLLAANTPFAAVMSGGTLQLNNSGSANSFTVGGNTGLFTINRLATLSDAAPSNVGSANVVVNTGGNFVINAAQNNSANMGNLGNLTIGGGTVSFTGSANTLSSVSVGTVTLAAGSSTITTMPGTGGSVQLLGTALVRNAGGTVDFIGPNLGVGA